MPDRQPQPDPPLPDPGRVIVHATCVALNGRGLLIRGPSGSGKSGLALSLMAMGASLVSDDRVVLIRKGDQATAVAPPAIRGLIEARGVGLLQARAAGPTPVVAVVDLGRVETERLPDARQTAVSGVAVDLLHKVESPHFAAALIQYLKAGRWND